MFCLKSLNLNFLPSLYSDASILSPSIDILLVDVCLGSVIIIHIFPYDISNFQKKNNNNKMQNKTKNKKFLCKKMIKNGLDEKASYFRSLHNYMIQLN